MIENHDGHIAKGSNKLTHLLTGSRPCDQLCTQLFQLYRTLFIFIEVFNRMFFCVGSNSSLCDVRDCSTALLCKQTEATQLFLQFYVPIYSTCITDILNRCHVVRYSRFVDDIPIILNNEQQLLINECFRF